MHQLRGMHWVVWFYFCVIVCSVCLILSWKFGGGHYYLWYYGNGYYYEHDLYRVVKECVPPYIDSYACDSSYIIVKQYPKGGWGLQPIYDENKIKYNNGNKTAYFWIINKKSEEIIGPLNNHTFDSMCDTLDIHLKLKKL